MSASRLKSFGKLAILLGLPVTLVGGLFGAGVYVGERHRVGILAFERDWLGRDVEVPGEPPRPAAETPAPGEPAPAPSPTAPSPTAPSPTTPTTPDPTPAPTATPEPTAPEPAPVAVPPALAVVADPAPVEVAEPAPLPSALQARLDEPVRVRVKVVVDADVFDRRRDWIAYTQRHVAWASQILERQVGVSLELRGVVARKVVWASREATLAELAEVPREDADLVIGLSGRTAGGPGPLAPAATASEHAPFAAAFANPASRAPHLRSLLAAVSAAMSAAPLDPDAPAYASGSWMGDPLARDSVAISLDEVSRERLLERKHLPFAAQIAAPAATAGEPDPQEGDE